MNLTLPTQLSAFSLLAAGDLHVYSSGIAQNLVLDDCRTALNNFPVNEDPIQYRPLRKSLADGRGLLDVETHGMCQLRLHASEKWVEERSFSE